MTNISGLLSTLLRLRATVRNWPLFLADHLGLVRSAYVCVLRDGTSFNIRANTDDRHVIFEIFVNRIYDDPIEKGDVVMDIGANIGGFTIWAARRGATVISFEPFPTNFAALEGNVSRNQVPATLVQAAVADAARTTEMFIPDDAGFFGRYSLHGGRGRQTIPVRCVSLDAAVSQYVEGSIDLLKIDCQGSEYELLYAAAPDTLGRVRRIVVECEAFPDRPDWSVGALAAYLSAQGYQASVDGNMVRARRREPARSREPVHS